MDPSRSKYYKPFIEIEQKKEQLPLKKKDQQVRAREDKLKSKSRPMTLYKATLEQNNELDIDPQNEPAKLMINLQLTQGHL